MHVKADCFARGALAIAADIRNPHYSCYLLISSWLSNIQSSVQAHLPICLSIDNTFTEFTQILHNPD